MKKSPKPTKRPARPALLQGDSTFMRLMLQIDGPAYGATKTLERQTAIAERFLTRERAGFEAAQDGFLIFDDVVRDMQHHYANSPKDDELLAAILADTTDVVSVSVDDLSSMLMTMVTHARNIGAGLMYGLVKTQVAGR